MQKATRQKTPAQPARATAESTGARQPGSAPQPLDLKSLERVAGGTAELPKKYW